jgi:hypothetical protein
MSLKLQNFHKVMGPAIGVPPLMSMHPSEHSSVFGDFGSTMRGIMDPFDMFGAARDLTHDIVRAPVDIAHEASTAFTGGVRAVGDTITGVAGVAGDTVKGLGGDLLSSPLLLIGGAALLLVLLAR